MIQSIISKSFKLETEKTFHHEKSAINVILDDSGTGDTKSLVDELSSSTESGPMKRDFTMKLARPMRMRQPLYEQVCLAIQSECGKPSGAFKSGFPPFTPSASRRLAVA